MKASLLRTDEEIIQLYEAYVDMVYHLCITMLKHKLDQSLTPQSFASRL